MRPIVATLAVSAAILAAGCAPKEALVLGAVEAGGGALMVGHAALSETPQWGDNSRANKLLLGIPLLVVGVTSLIYGLVEREPE